MPSRAGPEIAYGISHRRIAEAETAGNDQPSVLIGVSVTERHLDVHAADRIGAVGKGRAVIGAVQRACPGIDQPPGFSLEDRLRIGQMHGPLNWTIRRGQFAVAAAIKEPPEPEALRLPSDPALRVFVMTVRGHRGWRGKRQLGSDKPFGAVAQSSDTYGGEDFYGREIGHGRIPSSLLSAAAPVLQVYQNFMPPPLLSGENWPLVRRAQKSELAQRRSSA